MYEYGGVSERISIFFSRFPWCSQQSIFVRIILNNNSRVSREVTIIDIFSQTFRIDSGVVDPPIQRSHRHHTLISFCFNFKLGHQQHTQNAHAEGVPISIVCRWSTRATITSDRLTCKYISEHLSISIFAQYRWDTLLLFHFYSKRLRDILAVQSFISARLFAQIRCSSFVRVRFRIRRHSVVIIRIIYRCILSYGMSSFYFCSA